jgi:hypothetical protein
MQDISEQFNHTNGLDLNPSRVTAIKTMACVYFSSIIIV